MPDSFRHHGRQHARFLCSPISLKVCSNSCSLSQWCYLTFSSSAVPFSCLQSFPASVSFPMSRLFTSGSQSIGASASASRNEMSKFITQLQWKGGIGSKINNEPVEYNRESRNRLTYSLPHSWHRNWSLVEKRKSSIISAESIRYAHGEKIILTSSLYLTKQENFLEIKQEQLIEISKYFWTRTQKALT